MAIENPHELFLHELSDILAAEKKIVEMLPELIERSSDEELRDALEHHLEQTRGHVRRVEQTFESVGAEPQATECPSIDGIEEEFEETISEVSQKLYDHVVLSAVAATEHYEISTYEGLIPAAQAMGHDEAVRLLRENLTEEQEALERGKEATERLAREAVEMGVSREV